MAAMPEKVMENIKAMKVALNIVEELYQKEREIKTLSCYTPLADPGR